jgi:hypothetical protein
MGKNQSREREKRLPTLSDLPLPAKVLGTAIIFILGIAMLGAAGQIVVHDIIPTFFGERDRAGNEGHTAPGLHSGETELGGDSERGDLFGDAPIEKDAKVKKPFYQSDQFIWSLKWTHIHLFGIGSIFIFMGGIALFLNLNAKLRIWLIVLPFVGVLIDIAAVWLKGYVSPAFFWLHILGGNLFVIIFSFVSIRALWEMWIAFGSKRV